MNHRSLQASAHPSDVRAEMVARGKALIADPNYPSPEQIEKIASLLAAKWANGTLRPDIVGVRRSMDVAPVANSSTRCRFCAPHRSGRVDIAP